MAKRGLTAKQVEHIKSDPEKRIEIAAGPPAGLYLVVHPTGSKSWALRYRWRGRTHKLTFPQPYPNLSLAGARGEAEAKVDDVRNDRDPSAVQTEEIKQETPESVKAVADEWIKRYVKVKTAERSQDEYERILNKEVLPLWKDKLITEIGKPDVLRVIDGLMDRGTPALANKTLAIVKAWMEWAVKDRGYLPISPAAGIGLPSDPISRERVLEPGELVEVWNAADALRYPIGSFVQFLALVAQRRGEVATMQWADIDLKNALWTIPAGKTKSGRVHDVPLSRPALKIIENLPKFTKGDYLWTSTSGALPINGFSKAKNRIDAETLERRSAAGLKDNIADWTMHDLRRTAATLMAKSGVLPHVLSAILGHLMPAAVTSKQAAHITGIYNRHDYLNEKRAALEAWAKSVLSLTGKKASRGKAATA
ncbi:MAG TPA: tyrosine-type recombinase/integrase [Terriglobia bacterium]